MLTPVPKAEAAGDPRLGAVVEGRYRLSALLGRGGMCAVYHADDLEGGPAVAVKILPAQMAERPELTARFQREVASGRRIHHPNVVTVLGAGTLPDRALYMVMELLIGRSLAEVLHAGRLPIPRALGIAHQILLGLEATHALGIVHRDIKPENVMLVQGDGGEQVKLVDFGIASNDRAAIKLTSAGAVFGTPEYISPEMAMGLAVDPRADLYAVGVVLCEMVTGRRPFSGEPNVLLQKHVTETPPSPRALAPEAHIPSELDAAILRALAKLPEERFASAGAMIETLGAGTAKTGGKRRAIFAIAIVVLVAAAAAILFWSSSAQDPATSVPGRRIHRRHLRGPHHHGASMSPKER